VSLILVNFGFWIGSLWGDYPGETWAQGEDYRLWSNREAWRVGHLHVPEIAFIVGWAILIIAVGAWAARANRRWVVTTAAVFGAIEFYTQWFERLGAEPWAIIVAGLTMLPLPSRCGATISEAVAPLRSPPEPKPDSSRCALQSRRGPSAHETIIGPQLLYGSHDPPSSCRKRNRQGLPMKRSIPITSPA
jgi:hypothetical protein